MFFGDGCQICWALTLFWKSSFLKSIFSLSARCLPTALTLSPPLAVSWTQLQLCKTKPRRQQLSLIVCVCVCLCVFPRRSRCVSRSRYRSSACALCVWLIVLALARAAISIPPAGRRRKGQPRPCLREKEGWREEKDGASRRATTIGLSWIRLSLLPVIVAPAFVVRAPKRFEWKTSRMNYGCSGRGCRASGRINTDAAVWVCCKDGNNGGINVSLSDLCSPNLFSP